MKNIRLVSFVLLLVIVSISCSLFAPKSSNNSSNLPVVDFVTPAEPLNVTVQLDESSTVSELISSNGGSISLTAADGSEFTLDIPAKALETDTLITMTAVESIESAPLDDGPVAAVQLEPSGLFFNEIVTLTIVPAQEIPIEEQIIFGYEGDGQDYHLAIVDPQSREIKVKVMGFSGAGVGSGADSAWAANLQTQASNASTRLLQEFGEFTQLERRERILETSPKDATDFADKLKSTLDQFEDQVVLKEIVAAELDCKHAEQAIKDLLYLGRIRQSFFSMETPGFNENLGKLVKIMLECEKTYRVNDSGSSGRSWVTQCIPSLDKSYQLSWKSPGGAGEFSFFPDSGNWESGSAAVKVTNSMSGVSLTEEGEGTYVITVLSKDDKGNPVELSIDYEAKGTVTQCVQGGECTTKEDASLSGSVPIKITDKSCK